ncbi:hypothetical protein FRC00_011649 [Tulasnella sp. 408]|nr:hypothetical protein FRC00_011649 [Tulasnella sp. 408]
MLLQTPGAGPSTLGTAGQHGSSSTTTISDAKGEIIVKTSFALSSQRPSGTTRPSSANPLSARDGLCSRGSRKGKEKEIVDVLYSDAQIQVDSGRSLLPSGFRIPLTLGASIAAPKLPTESENSKPSSITELLPLLAIVNFADLLDEVIFKFVSNTSSILQELSSAVSARAGSLVFTAAGHIGHAKATLLRYSSLVRFGGKILARHVKKFRRMGRKRFNAFTARDFQAVVKAAKLQGYKTRKGCKPIENRLGSTVVEGQRRLAGGFGGTESAVIVDDEELD